MSWRSVYAWPIALAFAVVLAIAQIDHRRQHP